MTHPITFKKEPRPTGLARVAFRPYTTVKRRGRQVGILREVECGSWSVSVCVVDVGAHCGWRWVTFAARHPSEPDARMFLAQNWDHISRRYTIRELER